MIGPDMIGPDMIGADLNGAGSSMAGLGSTMAVVLAVVFTVAAITKASRPSDTATEFAELKLPVATFLAGLVPMIELITAAALVLRPRVGAVMAAALLLAFTTVIGATVRSGRSVSCGCLGAQSGEPVSLVTVARNLVLLAMAGVAGSAPTLTMPDGASIMSSLSLLLLAAVGLQLLALRRKIGRLWSVELAGERPQKSNRETITTEGIAI